MALLRTVLFFIFIYSASSVAQLLPNPHYTSYGIEDGLSNSMVYTIAQDRDGYMWFGTEDGLNRFDGQNFKVYRYEPADTNSLAGNRINQIYLANDNTLWIATHNGVSQYHKDSDSFSNFNVNEGLSHNNIQSVLKVDNELWLGTDNGLNVVNLTTHEVSVFPISDNGSGTNHKWIRSLTRQGNYVWIATWGGGLNRYDLTLKHFDYFRHEPNDDFSLSSDTVYAVYPTNHNEIWVGTVQGGVNRFKANCECFDRLNPNNNYQKMTVANFSENADSLWIATNNGLSQFSFKAQQFSNYSMLKPYELGNITRDVRSVFVSRDGTIWLGSFQGGVIAIPANGFGVQTYQYSEQAQNNLKSDDINSLYLKDGYLWTGAAGGLYRYPISESGALGKAELVLDIFTLKIEPSVDGSYWLATNDGLYHLDTELKIISHNDNTKLIPDTTGEGAVLDVVENQSGKVFVANWRGGLTQLVDEYKGLFKTVGLNGNQRGIKANSNIYALAADQDDQLWIGTMDGVNRYDINSDTIYHYALPLSDSQPQVTVYYVFIDNTEVYLGTNNGIYQYEVSSDTFVHHLLPLKSNYVQAIAKESENIYWLSTFNGLYRWDKSTDQVKSFFKSDGLQSSEFNTKGVATGLDDSLYFSGIDGVSRILPHRLIQSSSLATLRWISPSSQELMNTELNLELTQSTETVSLNYFVDDFYQPNRRQFRYRINQGQWIANGNATSIQFSGLASGSYRVELEFAHDGVEWRKAQSKALITITPPYYQSNIALMLYILLLVLVGYGYYRHRTKLLLRQKAQLQQTIDEKTAELASILERKNLLFANISHELRTPITLINAPIEQLSQDEDLNEQQRKLISLALNNGKRLFNLVERILHLSKVEQQAKQIIAINMDDLLIRYVIAFEPLMQQKQLKLTHQLDSSAVIQVDKEDVVSILENLLSNALKYTDAGGWVRMNSHVNNGLYQLSIKNSHQGLSDEQTLRVFDRFERLDQSDSEQGFGLGLALVKDICHQNNWQVACLSDSNSVTFTLLIEQFSVESGIETPAQRQLIELGVNKGTNGNQDKQTILVIEDNDELREFLVDLLTADYHTISAENGELGVKQAIEQIPDLVLSDVMMPKMDGYAVVKALSEHDNTCHIPVILLTARADDESQIKGLELGAVDYIAKPFEARQLLYKLKNTLERKRSLLHSRSDETDNNKPEVIVSERDKKFITRLNQTVEKHYSDNLFSVERLVDAVAMSERQLQRKLKALFNQTPAEYIRNYRLIKAKALLLEGKSISFVSDTVGFNSASYFSRSFKVAFGQSPKEFISPKSK
jgi:signal transduction histidine kinase/ligand-binding sensor domain-containing protein/DNA-binding response OmpR family regulator